IGPIRGAEGKSCTSPSRLFRGPCAIGKNCEAVCEKEGFTTGQCEGFRRRCICTKPCAP
ncbi:hypothetical protein Ancab_015051, partial [Ancistrocladus abbreviatus]